MLHVLVAQMLQHVVAHVITHAVAGDVYEAHKK
jgi:hypothetical protein